MPVSTSVSVPLGVASEIRELIAAGHILPGEQLPEAEYAARFRVSRNSLRESYRLLAREGLVEHFANRGVFVHRPTPEEITDTFRARELLETSVLRHADPDHPALMAMRDAVARARRAALEGDWRVVGSADVHFHEAVVGLADSPILGEFHRSLSARLRLMFGLLGDSRSMHEPFIDRNAQILQLLQEGRNEQAATAMHDYLADALDQIVAAYSMVGNG